MENRPFNTVETNCPGLHQVKPFPQRTPGDTRRTPQMMGLTGQSWMGTRTDRLSSAPPTGNGPRPSIHTGSNANMAARTQPAATSHPRSCGQGAQTDGDAGLRVWGGGRPMPGQRPGHTRPRTVMTTSLVSGPHTWTRTTRQGSEVVRPG